MRCMFIKKGDTDLQKDVQTCSVIQGPTWCGSHYLSRAITHLAIASVRT